MSGVRLPRGGVIDRNQPVSFRFDGRLYQGYAGDTLASALLANGVRLVGRSFKYHRPRGISSAGPEEASGLVTLRWGARREPNTRAPLVELYDGLEAESQSRWPSLRFDVGAVNSLLSSVFVAGFYYKTFMWPGVKGWKFYEHFIRKAAGLGRASYDPDPDHYERIEAFCDVLVVGAGPTGLAAALAAGRSGARVLLVDENPFLGGSVAQGRTPADAEPIRQWTAQAAGELEQLPEVRILTRTSAFGYYDGNVMGLVERTADHLPEPPPHLPRQRHWIVRASQVVLATGAIERPLVFPGNDRPGVMLAGAARTYLNRYAVLPGRRAVVFSNNDSGYLAARDLARAGAEVTLVDPRPATPAGLATACQRDGVTLHPGMVVSAVYGHLGVRSVALRAWRDGRLRPSGISVDCDLLLNSGGWSPTLHLHSQAGGRPTFDQRILGFVPGAPREPWRGAGACQGEWRLGQCLQQGAAAGRQAASDCGFDAAPLALPGLAESSEQAPAALWAVPGSGKRFVDLQNDVTTSDVALAAREGYDSVELLKRYTTLGMGTDQGKTGNINALALLALERKLAIAEVGTTTFRPPYTPVALGALAGHSVRHRFAPVRYTPMFRLHQQAGARFTDAGQWKRPSGYARSGESRRDAAIREARQVRQAVGITDVSTLGKIDVQGPDAALLLDRTYVNGWRKLQVGRARYGVMLREDGIAFDDGTTTRLADERFFMTTTTANAPAVLRHLEYLLQVLWPELRVSVNSATDQWAGLALAGPLSREVLAQLVDDDVSDTGLPFMGLLETRLAGAGIPLRIIRISFSGERAYELYVPADYGSTLWASLLEAGQAHDITPYGLDAMDILRIEKGHFTGAELDGRRTLHDLGMGGLARMQKEFIGRALMHRDGFDDPERPRLVGLRSVIPDHFLTTGAHLVREAEPREPCDSWGHVSSACFSPELGREIGLGFVRGGTVRLGETFYAADPLGNQHVAVEIVEPHFVDPQGERLRG